MIVLKSCPRCRGDMLREELPGDVELVCLQCGHRTYPSAITVQQPPATSSVTDKAA